MERRSTRSDTGREDGRVSEGGHGRTHSPRNRAETQDRGRGFNEPETRRRGSREESSDRAGPAHRAFSYKARSADDVKKRASESSRDFDTYLRDDVKMYKPGDGANTIRVLPPTWSEARHFALDIWVHYSVGPDEQTYLCLHKMKGEACPVCEELQRARKDREDEQYVKDLEPSRRSLFYLVDRDNEKDGVQAWAAPFTKIDQAIVKVSVDRRTNEVLPIDDPDDGYDVEYEKGGKGIGTQYTGVAIARRSSSLGNLAWLDFAVDNPLPEVLEYYSYDHIKQAFGGVVGRTDDKKARDDSSGGRSSHGADDRGRGRDDRSHSVERGSRDVPKNTWASVHGLQGEQLDDLIRAEKLDLNGNDYASDEDLADAICRELDIDGESTRHSEEPEADNSSSDRLREMREQRNRR